MSPVTTTLWLPSLGKLLRPQAGKVRLTIGSPFSVEEFVDRASLCQHPFERQCVPDTLVDSLLFKLSRPASELVRRRRAVIDFWRSRADDLAAQERSLHASMCPEIERVMASKRILVFGEMFSSISFPGRSLLLSHLTSRFPVCGDFPPYLRPSSERASCREDP